MWPLSFWDIPGFDERPLVRGYKALFPVDVIFCEISAYATLLWNSDRKCQKTLFIQPFPAAATQELSSRASRTAERPDQMLVMNVTGSTRVWQIQILVACGATLSKAHPNRLATGACSPYRTTFPIQVCVGMLIPHWAIFHRGGLVPTRKALRETLGSQTS